MVFGALMGLGLTASGQDDGKALTHRQWFETRTAHPEATQEIGSEWLRSGRTAHLRVPSALVPETYNYQLNPLHLQASQFQVLQEYHYPFDQRLKG